MSNSDFCHLHNHTSYSQLDGIGSPKQYAKKAKEMGFLYLGISDHGNVDGAIQFQKACKAEGIKSIIGCEMYIVPYMDAKSKGEKRGHITVLVKDESGWESLLRLLTRANLEGFYHRPRIDYQSMLDIDLSGLIIMTACAGSFLHLEGAEDFLWDLTENNTECYYEIMPHNIPAQKIQHKLITSTNAEIELPFCATNDCLIKDTLILTNKGHKPIQDIIINDLVLTHKNRFRKVISTNKRELNQNEKTYRLQTTLGTIAAEATGSHPFYICNYIQYKKEICNIRWRKTRSLRNNDYLIVPKINIFYDKGKEQIDLFDYYDTKLKDKSFFENGTEYIKNWRTDKNIKIPRFLKLDEELLSIIGIYIANGCRDKYLFGISIHKNKIRFLEKVKKYFEKFNLSPGLKIENNCARVTISSSIFAQLFSKLCGVYSHNKKIPLDLNLNKKQTLHILESYIACDGCCSKNTIMIGATTSTKLVYQLSSILNSLGFLSLPAIQKNDEKNKNWRRLYYVNLSGMQAYNFSKLVKLDKNYDKPKKINKRYLETNNFYALKLIKKQEIIDYRDYVYNFEVEEDNSYTANNYAVHNCHYINRGDWQAQEVLLAINRKAKWSDENRFKFGFKGLHLRSEKEMIKAFEKQNYWDDETIKEAMSNTIKIAEKCCDFVIPKQDISLPTPPGIEYSDKVKDATTDDIELDNLINKSGKINLLNNKEYEKREDHEFDIISRKGFSRYFLIVVDLLNWCKKNDVMYGPGRGCFLPKNMVQCKSTLKNIENIEIDDIVINHKGELDVVKKIFKYIINEKIIKVKIGNKTISCTLDHEVYTNKGWVKAGDLKRGDKIVNCWEIYKETKHNKQTKNSEIEEKTHSRRPARKIYNWYRLHIERGQETAKRIEKICLFLLQRMQCFFKNSDSKNCESKKRIGLGANLQKVHFEGSNEHACMEKKKFGSPINRPKQTRTNREKQARTVRSTKKRPYFSKEKGSCRSKIYELSKSNNETSKKTSTENVGRQRLYDEVWAKGICFWVDQRNSFRLILRTLFHHTLSLQWYFYPKMQYGCASWCKQNLSTGFPSERECNRDKGVFIKVERGSEKSEIRNSFFQKTKDKIQNLYRKTFNKNGCKTDQLGFFQYLKNKIFNQQRDEELVKKTWVEHYQGPVYDLKIKNERSYNIEGLAVHNSVGGSLIAYLLGITETDPIKYGLYFSRFISETRQDYPDIDIDFEDRKRHLVIEYLEKTYGKYNTGGISTFLRMKDRAVIHDVGRVFEVPIKEVNEFAGNIVSYRKDSDTLEKVIETDEGQAFKKKYPDVIRNALKLKGTIKSCLSGDSRLVLPNKKGIKLNTIKTLYNKKYKGLLRMYDFDKKILIFGKIKNIYESGIKKLYLVKIARSIKIKTTIDHKFLTKKGWKKLEQIQIGDFVATNGIPWNKGLKNSQIAWNKGLKGAQIAWNKGLTKEDHLSIKAASERMKQNNPMKKSENKEKLSKRSYKHGLYTEPKKYIEANPFCTICGRKAKEVHHIDKDRYNNDSNNLLSLCTYCHHRIHWATRKNKNIRNVNPLMTIRWNRITHIIPIEKEMTYDIEMDNKNQNFVANKVIVHNSGQHAAAVVISKEDLRKTNRCNLCLRSKRIMANFDMQDSEYSGLMKLDILGLNTLSVLSQCKKLIYETDFSFSKIFKFNKIPLDDKKVFKMLSDGDTAGVFQLSAIPSTKLCKDMGIKEFGDIPAILALVRPGPFYSGMTEMYVERNKGKTWEPEHSIYEEITKETHGLLVYQEQVMAVISKMAGLPESTADKIRKIIGKKRDSSAFEEYKKMFIDGCHKQKTFSKEHAEDFWTGLLEWASYGFSKSHAVEYALISYWTAWLKYYYPAEFMASELTYGTGKEDIANEARKRNIKIMPPKIGLSDAIEWKVNGKILYAPFVEIKGIGEKEAFKCLPRKSKLSGFFDTDSGYTQISVSESVADILNAIKAHDKEKVPDEEILNEYFEEGLFVNIHEEEPIKRQKYIPKKHRR